MQFRNISLYWRNSISVDSYRWVTRNEKRDGAEKPKGKKKTARAVQDRRAAPVSKVFTILAKNKVQRPDSLSDRHNWQQKPESPSMHSSSAIGVDRLRLLRLGKTQQTDDFLTSP